MLPALFVGAPLYKSNTLHPQSVLPNLPDTHNSRGKAGSTTWSIQFSAPVDKLWGGKALLIRTGHREIGTTLTSLEEEAGKTFCPVVTKYFPPLYIIWVCMPCPLAELNLLLFGSLFHLSPGTIPGVFLLLIWHFHLFFCRLLKLF